MEYLRNGERPPRKRIASGKLVNEAGMASARGDFQDAIGRLVALYHDSCAGYRLVEKQLTETQAQMMSLMPHDPRANSVAALDQRSFIHGKGEAWAPGAKIRHTATQGEVKLRNRGGGRNHHLIGNLCLVAIYQYWEDEFRSAIAVEMRIDRGELKAPIFGDLRLIRHAILHNGAVGTKDLAKCERFHWFGEGEPIAIDEKMFDEIADGIQQYLASLTNT
jgi:hypothetical protein